MNSNEPEITYFLHEKNIYEMYCELSYLQYIRVCTFFTFLSYRLVYMILNGQIDPKHQCKNFFFNFVV